MHLDDAVKLFGLSEDDFNLVPQSLFRLFQQRVTEYDQRLSDLKGMFGVAIYHSHILAAASVANVGDTERARAILNEADPKECGDKAKEYASELLKDEWDVIEAIRSDILEEVKQMKAVKGGVN